MNEWLEPSDVYNYGNANHGKLFILCYKSPSTPRQNATYAIGQLDYFDGEHVWADCNGELLDEPYKVAHFTKLY